MSAANLGQELIAAGKTFATYNEDLPSEGSTACTNGQYAQKHNPWFAFKNVPLAGGKTWAQFPTIPGRHVRGRRQPLLRHPRHRRPHLPRGGRPGPAHPAHAA
ncbi:hypothetical protein [Streptomyces sp. SLBN-118]|uniref:hypothetical protein n=1 Tax=Streptomyces sp. SLBN-118 TaxID=2768454 RepID=UPI0037DA3365